MSTRFPFNIQTHLWSNIDSCDADYVALKHLWVHTPLPYHHYALYKEEEKEEGKKEENRQEVIPRKLKLKIDNFARHLIITDKINWIDCTGDNIPLGALLSDNDSNYAKSIYLISRLLPFGLDINYINTEYDPYYLRQGSDPLLHIAIKKNIPSLVSLLLENGADFYYRNQQNKDALEVAIEAENEDIEVIIRDYISKVEQPMKKRKV
jgi:hypothetical protein